MISPYNKLKIEPDVGNCSQAPEECVPCHSCHKIRALRLSRALRMELTSYCRDVVDGRLHRAGGNLNTHLVHVQSHQTALPMLWIRDVEIIGKRPSSCGTSTLIRNVLSSSIYSISVWKFCAWKARGPDTSGLWQYPSDAIGVGNDFNGVPALPSDE